MTWATRLSPVLLCNQPTKLTTLFSSFSVGNLGYPLPMQQHPRRQPLSKHKGNAPSEALRAPPHSPPESSTGHTYAATATAAHDPCMSRTSHPSLFDHTWIQSLRHPTARAPKHHLPSSSYQSTAPLGAMSTCITLHFLKFL